jgi:hypothetical protein
MLLKPEDVSLFGLVWFLLFSTSTSKTSGFIQCKEEPMEGFWRRWYIFISLFAQKVLIYLGNPMDKIGKMLELGLNLVSNVLKGFFLINIQACMPKLHACSANAIFCCCN